MGNKLLNCSHYCNGEFSTSQIDTNEIDFTDIINNITSTVSSSIHTGRFNIPVSSSEAEVTKNMFKLNLDKIKINSKGMTNFSTERSNYLQSVKNSNSVREKFTFNPFSKDIIPLKNKGKYLISLFFRSFKVYDN